jgi:DEAD/DEAH box helicase domain-containing protein
VLELVEALRRQKWYAGQIRDVVRQDGKAPHYADIHPPPDPAVEKYLAARRIRPYSHQAEVLRLARAGRNVVLTTATASGKTLAFTLPVLEALARDPEATALYLYPMKALAYDQLGALRRVERESGVPLYPAVYDGDTPKEERSAIRARSRVILTNPHALHQYLPWHRLWERFFRNLKFVVIDEAHWYRGVFGAHVAFVIRRLRRLLEAYGADPQFILASATMADPAAHAGALVGKGFAVVDRDGAARAPKTYVLWDASLDPGRAPHTQVVDLIAFCAGNGLSTLCFAQTRRLAELISSWAAARGIEGVAAYRAGYLPEARREIERKLKAGELSCVVSTNALELGVDIGGLDAVVIAGWPGSVASFRQQAGRAGRSGRESLVIQVFYPNPLDAYMLKHFREVFSQSPEQALIPLSNPRVLGGHALCAAAEAPLAAGDVRWFGRDLDRVLDELVREKKLVLNGSGFTCALKSPAFSVKLSAFDGGEVKLCCGGEVLEVVGARQAVIEAHPGAVFLHGGRSYRVKSLDLAAGVAELEPLDKEVYTVPLVETWVKVEPAETRASGGVTVGLGRASVKETVLGYAEKSFETVLARREVSGVPPARLSTSAFFVEFPAPPARFPGDFAGGLHAAEHALCAAVPVVAMCDPKDVSGHSLVSGPNGRPVIYLYDAFPGGSGISERLFARAGDLVAAARELVASCPCRGGCPRCVVLASCLKNNEPLDKAAALVILNSLAAAFEAPKPRRVRAR